MKQRGIISGKTIDVRHMVSKLTGDTRYKSEITRTSIDIIPPKIRNHIFNKMVDEPWNTPPNVHFVTETFRCMRYNYAVRKDAYEYHKLKAEGKDVNPLDYLSMGDDFWWYVYRGQYFDDEFGEAYSKKDIQVECSVKIPLEELDKEYPGIFERIKNKVKSDYPKAYEGIKSGKYDWSLSINGRADWVERDDTEIFKGPTLYELKTINNMYNVFEAKRLDGVDKKTPNEEHREQVLFYMITLEEDPNYDIDKFNNVVVMYVDMSGFHQIALNIDRSEAKQIQEKIVNQAKKMTYYLVYDIIPPAERSWRCRGCGKKSWCDTVNDEVEQKKDEQIKSEMLKIKLANMGDK